MKMPGKGVIRNVTIDDLSVLQQNYMPFVHGGGLFIPTVKSHQLGDEIFLLLSIMDEDERIPVAAKVVWITPAGAQGGRLAGVGVQFSEQSSAARQVIENHLAGRLQSEQSTNTL